MKKLRVYHSIVNFERVTVEDQLCDFEIFGTHFFPCFQGRCIDRPSETIGISMGCKQTRRSDDMTLEYASILEFFPHDCSKSHKGFTLLYVAQVFIWEILVLNAWNFVAKDCQKLMQIAMEGSRYHFSLDSNELNVSKFTLLKRMLVFLR